jgi:hypothetical protein
MSGTAALSASVVVDYARAGSADFATTTRGPRDRRRRSAWSPD